jgi:uncharacterized protein (TIGR02147 family)
MSPLKFANYKEFLQKLIKARKERGYQSQMSRAMNCQAAYLSQVLKGKVDLTEDHAVKLAQFLKLNALESDYFILLVRLGRAATPELRKYLEERRVELLDKEDELQNKVHAKSARDTEEFSAKYFASFLPLLVHISTSSKHYQTVSELKERFGLSAVQIETTLKFLEEYKLVVRSFEKGEEKWKFSGESIHLPKSSSMNVPYQVSLRTLALKSIQEKKFKENLHFSSVFTMDKKSYKEIFEILNRAIEDSHKVIHDSGTEEVYSMSIDYFKVV